jgi:uncharacterized membrane protein
MVGPINAFKFMHVDSAWLSVLLIVVAFFVVHHAESTCMNLNALIGPTIPIKPKPADSFVP